VIVVEEADGASLALGSKGDAALDPSVFQDDRHVQLLRDADVLFITFEPKLELIEAALDACERLGDDKPLVVLTPAPPYDESLMSGGKLDAVDVIVANEWEAERLLQRKTSRKDLNRVVLELLGCGVEALCVFNNRGVCTVNVRNEPVIVQ